MMNTKELIEAVKNERGSAFQNCNDCEYGTHNGEVIEKLNHLAELEDDLESGKMIRLPCKDLRSFPCEMGATVWLIYKRYWNVADKNGFWVLRESKVSPHNKKRFSDDFGKFLFLNREEAEAKLKELQNG